MNNVSLYQENILPKGFKYPAAFVSMVESGTLPDIYPWWFIDANSEIGEGLFERRRRDGRNLIPFSKVDGDLDDIACFDGDDASGDPTVHMLILDESDRKYSFKNFDEWFNFAKKYSFDLKNFLGIIGSDD